MFDAITENVLYSLDFYREIEDALSDHGIDSAIRMIVMKIAELEKRVADLDDPLRRA